MNHQPAIVVDGVDACSCGAQRNTYRWVEWRQGDPVEVMLAMCNGCLSEERRILA